MGAIMTEQSSSETELKIIDWDTDPTTIFPVGRHKFHLEKPGNFDIQVVGAGGGGSGTRTRKEGSTGGGGACALFVAPLGSALLESGDYLVKVGAGGKGGMGSLNWGASANDTKGGDGEESGIWRVLPTGTIKILVSHGGTGGQEFPQSTVGEAGRDFVDPAAPANALPIGKGGPGGSFGGVDKKGGKGGDAIRFGAGGGGQGAGLVQINPAVVCGGLGAPGTVVLVKRDHH